MVSYNCKHRFVAFVDLQYGYLGFIKYRMQHRGATSFRGSLINRSHDPFQINGVAFVKPDQGGQLENTDIIT